ncbi:lysine N(6)-hydroxylase/L-ornithine N(5)-oxygenase family protein [Nitriliruptoraceae bacterium ZYF776]|nr:lysine N(6)-hydroxylase/L-ornithine N(5)-oxygenase family protein [Profundirhabdus halotolerans]
MPRHRAHDRARTRPPRRGTTRRPAGRAGSRDRRRGRLARTGGARVSGTLIIGAGPAGLAVATALSCHGVDDLEVVDPSGTWMTAWHRRFAAQDIPHLRSPAVHHPHPDPFALLEVTPREELVRSGGTSLPTTASFRRFCELLVERRGLADAVTATHAEALEVGVDGRATVHLADGTSRTPDRVVLATNARQPTLPEAIAPLRGHPCVAGTETAAVADTPAGGHVVVVGGGLSAGHLAVGAARRGAQVTLAARRRLMVRRFDTEPAWLGPKKRRPFEADPDPRSRRRTIDHARGGGSVPHRMHRAIGGCAEEGRLDLRERVEVDACHDRPDGRVEVRFSDGHEVVADAVWAATGGAIDVTRDALCRALAAAHATEVADGLPVLTDDLRWPGTNVHLAGFVAALTLGPTAGNLVGQRRAALRIAAAVRGDDPVRADRVATGTGACPAESDRRFGPRDRPNVRSRPGAGSGPAVRGRPAEDGGSRG